MTPAKLLAVLAVSAPHPVASRNVVYAHARHGGARDVRVDGPRVDPVARRAVRAVEVEDLGAGEACARCRRRLVRGAVEGGDELRARRRKVRAREARLRGDLAARAEDGAGRDRGRRARACSRRYHRRRRNRHSGGAPRLWRRCGRRSRRRPRGRSRRRMRAGRVRRRCRSWPRDWVRRWIRRSSRWERGRRLRARRDRRGPRRCAGRRRRR